MNVPLKVAFDDLFKLVKDPEATMSDCWVDDEWWVVFRRALSVTEFERWSELKGELEKITIDSDNRDVVSWGIENKGIFTTKSLYSFLTDGGMPGRVAGYIWKCRIPLKIKFFLWQIFNNKLQCATSLVRRGWRGSETCCLGDGCESVNHIFFGCYIARMIWGFLRDIFKWDNFPPSLKEFSESWLLGKGPMHTRLILFIFAGFAWAIWTNRNKMAIQLKFPKSLTDIIYTVVSFLQKWSIMLKEADRERIKQVKDNILLWVGSFKPTVLSATDVFEI
jgi:hypothetical protein